MVKRDETGLVYVCDHCVQEMPGPAILVFYPYGHINDSADGASHFCSDECLMEFERQVTKRYGKWKSSPIPETVRPSEEDTKAYIRTQKTVGHEPKARRGRRFGSRTV